MGTLAVYGLLALGFLTGAAFACFVIVVVSAPFRLPRPAPKEGA